MRAWLSLGCIMAVATFACGDSGAGAAGGTGATGGQSSGGAPSGGSSQGGGSVGGAGGDPSTGGAGAGPVGGNGPGGCRAVFDGVDDGLFAAVGSEAGRADDFSVAAVVAPEPLAAGQTAFLAGRHQDGNSNGYYLALAHENGQLNARFIVFTGGGTCSVSAPLGSGAHHLLGSFSAPDARIFIDGSLAATADCGNVTCNIASDSVFTVGRSQTGIFPYGGEIDHVAYISQAFSAGFDPAALACSNGAALLYDFEAVTPGRATTVPEVCGTSADASVGTAAGADAADPQFLCP